MGVPEEEIEAALAKAAEFEDEDDTGEVLVWAENWTIVEVFTSCRWCTAIASGPAGAVQVYEHIPAAEVLAVCELMDVPRRHRRDVLWGVGVMQATAKPVLNQAG